MEALWWIAMHEGTWTIRPCPRREVRRLATAPVSAATASVLVRRGYGDPEAARASWPRIHQGTTCSCSTPKAACALIRETIAAGGRICVHGDYDVGGICATALAVTALRDLGADVEAPPSRFEEELRGFARDARALGGRRLRLVLTVDCGLTAVEEIAEARAAGLQVVVTDHHRPADPFRLPDRGYEAIPYGLPRAVQYRGRLSLAAYGGAGRAGLTATSTSWRWRRWQTSSRSGREPCARLRRDATAGADGQARPAASHMRGRARPGNDRHRSDRVPSRTAHQCGGRLGHPRRADSPTYWPKRPRARRPAGELEALNRDRQAVEERTCGTRSAGGGVALSRRPPPRVRHRGRGLAPRRDQEPWRRGSSSASTGLIVSSPAASRGGPLAPAARSRRSTSTGALGHARICSAAGGTPRGRRALDRAGERRSLHRGVRRARCGRADAGGADAGDHGRRRRARRRVTLGLSEELERLAPSASGTRTSPCSRSAPSSRSSMRSARESTYASR